MRIDQITDLEQMRQVAQILEAENTRLHKRLETLVTQLAALQIDGWICVMVTGGTQAPIVARLDGEISKALAVPAIRDTFAKQGIEIAHMSPNQLGAFLQAEAARFSGLLKHSRVSRASP